MFSKTAIALAAAVPVTDICVGDLEIGSPKTWKARPVHTLGELLNLMRRRRV